MKDVKFCTCGDLKCPNHPANHEEGCTLCIEKNLRKKEIPSCFFKMVNEDISNQKEFTFEAFAEFLYKHKK
ncbi:DUF6485 family protein [Clostridium sp. DL1XJH146]